MGKSDSARLRDHPNFRAPEVPVAVNCAEVVRFTLNYCASLVSPPKGEGEDESKPCQDVAAEIRSSFNEIMEILAEKAESK